jgi:hypothetical protein
MMLHGLDTLRACGTSQNETAISPFGLPYVYEGTLEAAMRRRSLTLAAAVTAITYGGVLATRAEDWKPACEYDYHDTAGRVYEMEKGHTYWIGEFVGICFNNKGKGSLFDQAEVRCFGFNDVDANNKRIKQGGHCVSTDADGDHAYSTWEANDTLGFEVKGTLDYTGGTGKYNGITGKNTYRAVGYGLGRGLWNDAQPRKVPVLGLLDVRTAFSGPNYFMQHFFGGLRALGWTDNYTPIRLDGVAGDELAGAAHALVAQSPTVIVALGDSAIRTAQAAATSIPIVGLAEDMAASRFVASLARPGGKTTGISILSPELAKSD